jgi:PmbA protein
VSALRLAERALSAVSKVDAAQASVTVERSLVMRFARSRPTQATAIEDLTVEVTALRAGHVVAAATNRTEDEALAACAEAAAAGARAAARAGEAPFPGFPGPAEVQPHSGHDAETARLDAGRGVEALAAAFAAAAERQTEAHGIWTAGEVETALASTEGLRVADRVTDAYMKVVCLAPSGRSGYASRAAVAASRIDPGALARRAADKAAAPGAAVRLPPADYPVVFEPAAVGELLSYLGWTALNGLAYAEDRSAFCGRLGDRVAAAGVNLADLPRHPRTLPRAFDAEGVPKSPLPLIQDGVARAVVHDTRSAALARAASTGHALTAGGSAAGPAPTNLVLAGEGAAGESELCSTIDRGVYVTRLWYTNAVRPKETLVTSVTRDGTFLIEHGEVTRPLEELRLTDTLLGVLDRTEALGARQELWSDSELYGRRFATGVVAPPLRSAATFTGAAEPPRT